MLLRVGISEPLPGDHCRDRKVESSGLLVSVGFLSLISSVAWAQTAPPALAAPVYSTTDVNHVNLLSGLLQFEIPDVSIGSAAMPLTHSVHTNDNGSFDAYSDPILGPSTALDFYAGGLIDRTNNLGANCPVAGNVRVNVILESQTDLLCGTGGTYSSITGKASTLVDIDSSHSNYTRRDGTVVAFAYVAGISQWESPLTETTPGGYVLTFNYYSVTTSGGVAGRLQSITRNDGLQLHYQYASDAPPTSATAAAWHTVASVTALNNAIDYCAPTATSCTYTPPWPTATYSWTPSGSNQVLSVKDMAGQATNFTIGVIPATGNNIAILSYTTATGNTTTATYCYTTTPCINYFGGVRNAAIWKLQREGQTWLYSTNIGGSTNNVITQYGYSDPAGAGGSATHESGVPGPLMTYADGKGLRTISFDTTLAANHPNNVVTADGVTTTYYFDGRENLKEIIQTPSSGSSLSPTTQFANYDATCTSTIKCNKPNSIVDANGNQTDYTYDLAHGGGLQTVTRPAPATNAARPQTRYTYVQRYAWYKNSPTSIVQAATPIWVLNTESYCRTSNSNAVATNNPAATGCTASNDEVVTTYDYGPTSGANNLFLRGIVVTADGQSHRTCYGYDVYGNRVSETSANAGLASCP